ITARLLEASTATPQLKQLPPENAMVRSAELVKKLVIVVPESVYTSVLFAAQTVTAVFELVEHELGGFGVGTVTPQVPVQIGSMGITWIPVLLHAQQPLGT